LLDALKKAEAAVEKYHAQQRDLETQLADEKIYADSEKAHLKTVLEQKTQIDKLLDEAEMRWLDLQEQLEAFVD
jgi:ATP-binding cassette, subfamily F, member 3